jgi:hypothetical protein
VLDQQAAMTDLDRASLGRILEDRLPEIERMFGDRTPQARQMLRALLADKIEMEPVVEDGRRGYR